jgi:hypothetical protein
MKAAALLTEALDDTLMVELGDLEMLIANFIPPMVMPQAV